MNINVKKIKTVYIITDSESDNKAELTLYPDGTHELLRIRVSNEEFIEKIKNSISVNVNIYTI